ncbi:MAG TPA: ribosome biogenesis GTPase Der [Chthoniobacteraceae bacterium]|nr:ribosome biogenesis GTPase Der [Chthoniobacteraceae bacterium]
MRAHERTVALVGRPNVGKSALFNRLVGRKISIVHDMPGVTRDRIVAECRLGADRFTVIDTGGIGSAVDAAFTEQVHAEVDIAIETADLLVFLVDGKEGLMPIDQELARRLRRAKKPVLLVVNKIDVDKHAPNAAEFSRLGFENQISVSAEHNRAIAPLVAWIERLLPAPPAEPGPGAPAERPLSIAIVGRPNVGKSSLINAIVGDARTLVSEISGTTRDAVDIPYERHGHRYVLIDTAGIRPRSKVAASVEVFSVMRAETSIRRADLCCLVVDAVAGVTMQDKKIAGLIQEARKPCVIIVNKSDLVRERTSGKEPLNQFIDELRNEMFFLGYAPLILTSARTKSALTRLFKAIEQVQTEARVHLGTGPLNRLISSAVTAHPPPARGSRRFKILYATQAERPPDAVLSPPEFVFFCNDETLLPESYRRFLEARIREAAPYPGLPMLFRFRGREVRGRRGGRRE